MRFLLLWVLPLCTIVLVALATHQGALAAGLIVAAWIAGLVAVATDGQRPDV